MTLLWSPGTGSGSERGSCERTLLQNFQDAAIAKTRVQPSESGLQLSAAPDDRAARWSSGLFGMGNPFRPLTRQSQSRSPTRPAVVRRASASTSSSSQQLQQQQQLHHHHHHQRDHASLYQPPPPLHAAASPASTSGSSERAAKRIKLTVRRPTIASPTTRPGQSAKNDDDSVDANSHAAPPPRTGLTVAAPRGEFLQTVNGLRASLSVADGSLPTDASRASTAEPAQGREREPAPTRKASDRRSLRSHDEGPRLKSELAVYFPYYEDVIYDAPKEPELFNADTVIVIKDEPSGTPLKPKRKSKEKGKAADDETILVATRHLTSPRAVVSSSTSATSPSHDRNRFNGAQIIDFSSIERSVGHHPRDPLTDAFYFKSHRRAERKEKQLRNIEKERAMHEKAQLERLLDGLQGHDWLRMMGITGVTDTEAKKFEPKRDYFISEVQALLQKFKTWKEEERRLKLEKEAAVAAEEEAEDEEEDEEDEDVKAGSADESDDDPSSSDCDGAAARQLQLEASSGGKGKGGKGGKGKQRERAQAKAPPPPLPIVYRPPTPEGPFTSFYAKPHLRAAALGKARHGRNLTAFGQPIPEPEEQEFALPDDYISAESIKESARRRRRMKRESLAAGSGQR